MRLAPLVSLLSAALAAPVAQASPSGVVISQVYGANGNAFDSDYVELHNSGSTAVSLSGWSIQYASATGTGNFSGNGAVALTGTLQPGQFYLVKLATAAAGAGLPVTADVTGTLNLSSSAGKVILARTTSGLACNGGSTPCTATQLAQIEDLVGYGTANFFEGAAAASAPGTTQALFRAAAGCTDTNNNSLDFAVGSPAPRNTASTLVICGGGSGGNAPIVPSCPDATAVAGTASSFSISATDADSRVTAASLVGNLPSGVTLGSFSAASGAGAAATQSFDASSSVAAGAYTLSIKWDNSDTQSANCSFKLTVSGLTAIPAIQGNGARSPMEGQAVTTSGVVTRLMSNGFYLQDPIGDGDPATSDGIFVFTSSPPSVAVGQKIRLSGTVTEFNTGAAGNADTLARPVTQLSNPTGITVLGTGFAITPVEVDLATLPAGGLEAFEGMVVTLRGPLMAQQNYFLGRFGQVTLAAGGRVYTPTQLLRPGVDALALQADNARRSILLDDGSSAQNPNPAPYIGADNTLRAGDTVASITGVIDYGLATSSNTDFGLYKIHPLEVAGVNFARTHPRVATPQVSGGNVRIASANVLNFFTSFTDGTAVTGSPGCSLGGNTSSSNCRGADNLTEFNRQLAKTVAALSSLDADVVGLMEIQNNGNTTVNYLVAQLNAALGAGTYASVPLPAQGTGADAIRVAMIYKPGKLMLNGVTIADADPINSRPPLAQGFSLPNGERFAVVVNHLKSKGSCPTAGDTDAAGNTDDGLQGCGNARRVAQAQQLRAFLPAVQSAAGTDRVVLLGDFNAYAKEDPIDTLTRDGSIVDVVSQFDPLDYSYVFDGAAGRLDHGLTTATLAPKVVYATSWHINADEPSFIDYNTEFKLPFAASGSPDLYSRTPYRSSDHDPMVMGLNLVRSITAAAGSPVIGTPGDDLIESGPGAKVLTGGGGRDQFAYVSLLSAGDVITDFKPGIDQLVLTRLLASLGITSADPLASGHVACSNAAAGAVISIDTDGRNGPLRPRALLQLRNVSCAALSASSFKF
jgi:predicted extracellular nuclease